MKENDNYKLILISLVGFFMLGITAPVLLQKESSSDVTYRPKVSVKIKSNESLKEYYPIDRFTDEELNSDTLENFWGKPEKKKTNPNEIKIVGEFSEGLAIFSQNSQYGYIDKKGNIAIAAKYDRAGNFSEHLAAVIVDGKSFFIDSAGRVAIALEDYDAYSDYDLDDFGYATTLSEFKNGVAKISKPKFPVYLQLKTKDPKPYLCNAIDRSGRILSDNWLCEM